MGAFIEFRPLEQESITAFWQKWSPVVREYLEIINNDVARGRAEIIETPYSSHNHFSPQLSLRFDGYIDAALTIYVRCSSEGNYLAILANINGDKTYSDDFGISSHDQLMGPEVTFAFSIRWLLDNGLKRVLLAADEIEKTTTVSIDSANIFIKDIGDSKLYQLNIVGDIDTETIYSYSDVASLFNLFHHSFVDDLFIRTNNYESFLAERKSTANE